MKKKKEEFYAISPTAVDEAIKRLNKQRGPVFQFREIRSKGRPKLPLDFNALQEAYDRLNSQLDEAIAEDELNEAYTRGEEYGRTAGAKNELEYLIDKVKGLWETDKRKQQLDDELEFAYKFAINLLNGELNKYKSYNLDRGENK